AEHGGRAGSDDGAHVVRAVRGGEGTGLEIGQPDDPARRGPRERLRGVAEGAADADAARGDPEALGRGLTGLDHADVDDHVLGGGLDEAGDGGKGERGGDNSWGTHDFTPENGTGWRPRVAPSGAAARVGPRYRVRQKVKVFTRRFCNYFRRLVCLIGE